MKRVLITGAHSYVGTNVEKWLMREPDKYYVETLDMKDPLWKEFDFSNFDVVFHVAGIAHVSSKKNMENLYYQVNRNLTIETAEKAKFQGVKQFIFMSSIIVYGDSRSSKCIIDRNTIPKPSNFYGNSKLQAEEGIRHLEADNFMVVVLRPPMIYGKDSKGNYRKFAKIAKYLPVFPDIDNERSMLHIDNLCEFIRQIIINEESGLFFPQNKEYVKTSDMARMISEVYGKKIRLTKVFNRILKVLSKKFRIINKIFGNLTYEKTMSEYKTDYRIMDIRESIIATESET